MEAGQRRASCFCMKDIGVSITCRPWRWETNRKRTVRSSQDLGGIGGLHRTDLHKQAAGLEIQSRTGLHSRSGTPGRHRPARRFLPISNTPDTSPTSPQMSLRASGWRRVASSEVSFSKTAVWSGFRHSISHVFINRDVILLLLIQTLFSSLTYIRLLQSHSPGEQRVWQDRTSPSKKSPRFPQPAAEGDGIGNWRENGFIL